MEEERQRVDYRKIFLMLWPSIKSEWFFLPLFVFMAFVVALLSLSEPFIYGSIIDRLIAALRMPSESAETLRLLFPFLAAWVGVVVCSTLLGVFFSYGRWFFGNKVAGHFLRELYARMLRLDIRLFQEQQGGETLRRFDNAWDAFWQLNEHGIRDYLQASVMFLLALGVGFWIDWRLTIVALLPVPVIVGIGLFNLKFTEPGQYEANQIWDQASGAVGDSFSNITTVKTFAGEERSVKKIWRFFLAAFHKQRRVNQQWAIGDALMSGIYVAGRLAIFLFGAWFVLHGSTTIGTLIMFLGFLSFIFGAVQQIAGSLLDVSRALTRLNRVTRYWYEVPAVKDKPGAKTVGRLQGEVVFNRVSYAYREGSSVLKDVSFTIPAGKTFAMVGESGAGKSTLAQTLLRFHDPTSGKILIDGIDLRDITLKSLRSNIGFVMQENILFHDSIMNNILFAKPNASEREVIAAAKRAQAHEFIKGLKKGYKTIVGERGVKLSGGEKQRVALARVLLADPPILVLDEATSALDSKTEHALQAALHEVMKDRTTLVIAHRLSTVMQADNILVLHKGRIVDEGKHEDLIQRGGLYKQYWEIQAGGYV